jgi:predicted secreted protein
MVNTMLPFSTYGEYMDTTLKNVVGFTITADQDVDQDFIAITFSASESGTNANDLQALLATKLKAALDIAKAKEVPGKVEVRSGIFQINPTYNKQGVVSGYIGTVTMVVSGTDSATILALTGTIKTMTVNDVQQSISAARRKEVEQILALKAIKLWRERSKTYSDAFAATSFTLLNADISFNNRYPTYARSMSVSLEAAGGSGQIAAEPGKETLTITVSGTIQLHA